MGELLLRAEFWFRLVGHYLEPVRLAIHFYQAVRWLIKLPGRAANAYRELRDWFRFLPQRMVAALFEQIAGDFVFRIGRAVAIAGLLALVGTALYFAAKGTAITKVSA